MPPFLATSSLYSEHGMSIIMSLWIDCGMIEDLNSSLKHHTNEQLN